MASAKSVFSRSKTFLGAIILFVLFPVAMFAQQGAVTGRVMNEATGKYLANAVISVDGTSISALTDDIGSYRLSNLAPGNYTITARYVDLDNGTNTVTVSAGETASVNFNLTSNVYLLEKFVVSSEREGAAKALQDQRYSSSMINVVAADSFGNMVDGNIGELMKKLPGVAIDYNGEDAGAMRIRGMPPEMASVTLDGNPIASGGGGTTRAFDLSSFAVQNIETIEVNFAPTPDQSANNMGGSINFKTKNAFAQKGRRIRIDGNLSLNTRALDFGKTPGGERTPDRKIKPGIMLQYTESFGSVRPVGISIVANFFQKYRHNNNYDVPYAFSTNALEDNGGIATADMQGTIGNVTWTERGTATERRNINVNLDWKASDNTILFLRTGYTHDVGIGQYTHQFRINTGSHLSATADHPESNFDQIVGMGSNIAINSHLSNEDTKLWNVTLGAQHKFGRIEVEYDVYASQSKSKRDPKENFYLTYGQTGVNMSVYNVSGNASGEIRQTDINGVALPIEDWSYLDISQYDSLTINQDYNDGSDDQLGGKFNVTVPVTVSNLMGTWNMPVKIKFGGSYNQQKRDTQRYYRTLRLTGNSSETAFGTAAEPSLQQFADPYYSDSWRGFDNTPIPQWLSPYKVYDHYLAYPEQFYRRLIDFGNKGGYLPESEYGRVKEGNKESQERVYAGYVMATANISRLTILAGVRYESTKLEGWGNVFDQIDDAYAAGKKYDIVTPTSPYYQWDVTNPFELADLRYTWSRRTYDYDRYFPNVQLKYDITSNLVARVSYTTGMGRPNLTDVLWAMDRVTPSYKLIRRPNTELRPQTNKLYQARLEYYFSKFGSATATVFYQPYKNYIYSVSTYEPYTFTDDGGELTTELWEVQMNRNVGDGRNYGFEVSYQQRLGFIADWLNRVEFYATFSMSDPKAKYPYRQPASTVLSDEEAEEWNKQPAVMTNVPLTNIKERYATASISYKGSKFSATVTAMWTDDYTRSLDTDTLAETRYAENIRLDLSMNYRLSRHWQAYFDWRNFNNVKDERNIFSRTAGYYESGMVINLGVRADF